MNLFTKTMNISTIKKMLAFAWVMLISVSAFAQQDKTGFLVLAPDRGFMGNQEIRDLHAGFDEHYTTSLAFITPEETDRFLAEAVKKLQNEDVSKLVVIPMFLSDNHPLYKLGLERLNNGNLTNLPIEFAEPMSQNYLVGEILADRITELSQHPEKEALVLVTTGASTEEEKEAIKADLEQVVHMNHGRFAFNSEAVVVFGNEGARSENSQKKLEKNLSEIKNKGFTPVVIPFGLTQKLDGMMAFSSRIQPLTYKYGALYNGKDLTPHKDVELWLAKQANSYLPVTKENLGVVFMPHGSDYNWNRTMMDAIAELHNEYKIEYAFSMGDADLIEQAARKLEKRGATAITVLRIFSLESSFKKSTEFLLGLRKDIGRNAHMMHGAGMPPRIRSGSIFYTTGGLEDSPLFAEALLDRAIALSENPEKETIILVGHGTRTEEGNTRWLENLKSITEHMEKTAREKGYQFRGFKYENWREDWPKLREKRIKNVRSMVKEAGKDGGTAIVIPARTTQGGHARRWLGDLEFRHDGEGFAPHPLFVQWVEGLIQESLDYFNNGKNVPTGVSHSPTTGAERHPSH
ncbi:MAG: hypothetical protein FH748_01305 [Balneolaceae bacterium]|nr:hypothetical protein [Balneolaceae bacterium]